VSEGVVVRRLAEAELDEARAWYELQVRGLGDQFLEQFRQSAVTIAENPLRWPLYHKSVRRYVMARFPYVIYFDIRPRAVRILRVVHTSRDPGPIKELLD
jgi:toxin ParE1/3/4